MLSNIFAITISPIFSHSFALCHSLYIALPMSNQIRILGNGSKHSGVTYHRIALPLSTMAKEYAMITDTPTGEMIKEKDINIFLVNRFSETASLIQILEWKQKYGFKLVVDIDDYWELFSQHNCGLCFRNSSFLFLLLDSVCTFCFSNRNATVSKRVFTQCQIFTHSLLSLFNGQQLFLPARF